MINKIKWIPFVISLFFIASCDSVSNIEILNTNIDSVLVYGISSDIYVYRYNQKNDSIIQNGKINILLKEKDVLIFGDAINELQLNEIPIDTLIIFTKTDTLYKLYGQNEIFEVFKNNKRFFGGYCLEVSR